MPLYEENGYLPDFEKIDPAVLEKEKLMFLNYRTTPLELWLMRLFMQELLLLRKSITSI